jgi:hypothetical protein
VTGSRTVTPSAATAVAVTRTETWNAVRYALTSTGPLAGSWIPVTALAFD